MTTTMKALRITYFSLLFIALFIGCSSDDSNNPSDTAPSTITINAQDVYTGFINQIFQLSATVRNVDGEILNNQQLNWSSSDPNIASINNEGELQIIDEGIVTISASVGAVQDSKAITIQFNPANLITFTVDELSTELGNQGVSQFRFLEDLNMAADYSEWSIGESSQTSTASLDQVYYFHEGTGTMSINGNNVTISSQSAIYITSGSERSISSVATDMKVIILESKSLPSGSTSPYNVTSYAEMVAPRNPNANIWNPFLEENTLLFGLYMLPQTVGGDSTIVHSWDELNIITSGSSLFETDHGDVLVEEGSVVFVRQGNPHRFNNLTEDIDILIFWNM